MENLSAENMQFLRDLVTQGNFLSETEALNVAVGLLRKRQDIMSRVREGTEQAKNGQLLPADEVFSRLESRAQELDDLAK